VGKPGPCNFQEEASTVEVRVTMPPSFNVEAFTNRHLHQPGSLRTATSVTLNGLAEGVKQEFFELSHQ